jgi:hypothetical protein
MLLGVRRILTSFPPSKLDALAEQVQYRSAAQIGVTETACADILVKKHNHWPLDRQNNYVRFTIAF